MSPACPPERPVSSSWPPQRRGHGGRPRAPPGWHWGVRGCSYTRNSAEMKVPAEMTEEFFAHLLLNHPVRLTHHVQAR